MKPKPPYRRHSADLRLLRFLARHGLTGVIAAWVLLIALVKTGVGGLDGLMGKSAQGWLAYLLLAVVFAITGAAVAMGLAVFALDETGDAPGPPRYKAQDEDEDA